MAKTQTELLAEANDNMAKLIHTIETKDEVIDARIEQKETEVDYFLKNARQDNFILTGNLLKDSFMQYGTEFYAAAGVTIEAVHPFTKAFEGPYVETKPSSATDDPSLATKENPYWYGRYNKGPRLSRGGLADGWGGISNGNILKITKEASQTQPTSFNSVFFTQTKMALHNRVRFRAYLYIEEGSCSFGTDAGHVGIHRGKKFDEIGVWIPVDFEIGVSETVIITSSAFCMGFDYKEKTTAFLALPEITLVPGRGTDMQIIQEVD